MSESNGHHTLTCIRHFTLCCTKIYLIKKYSEIFNPMSISNIFLMKRILQLSRGSLLLNTPKCKNHNLLFWRVGAWGGGILLMREEMFLRATNWIHHFINHIIFDQNSYFANDHSKFMFLYAFYYCEPSLYSTDFCIFGMNV